MTFAVSRGKVERVCPYFTHVRLDFTKSLFLFNHLADNAAAPELRKEGEEVEVYRDPADVLLHVRKAAPHARIPQRGAPQAAVEQPTVTDVQRVPPLIAPKIPLRRR